MSARRPVTPTLTVIPSDLSTSTTTSPLHSTLLTVPSIFTVSPECFTSVLNFDPFAKYGGVGELVDLSDGYLVVMQHPVTTEYHQARAHANEIRM